MYERAVGLYASMIGINAYHQPGVEAGKKAAGEVIALQTQLMDVLRAHAAQPFKIEEIAQHLGSVSDLETLFKICEHLSSNPDRKIGKVAGETPFQSTYAWQG